MLAAQRALTTPGWIKSDIGRKARALPSLDLRFADSKSLVDATTGANLVTFTRASSGTYVDSQGVIRTATTNLLLRSEEFDNASWVAQGGYSVTSNQAVSPNGTLTAELVSRTNTGTQYLFQSVTASGKLTVSCWVRTVSGTATFRLGAYNVTDGFKESSDFTATTTWQRYSFTVTQSATSSSWYPCNGAANSSFYIWGAQLEQSSTVGEYIPTTSTINSAPRFDHNPTTGESLGLLVEESRTNLATQSEALDALPWGVTALTVVANSTDTLSPDGVTYPEKFLETSATSNHTFFRAIGLGLTAGAVYTASVFIKRIAGQFYQIIFDDNATANGGYVNVDLINGTVAASANYGTGASIASSITRFGNGWFRISITSTAGSSATVGRVAVNTLTSGTQTQFFGFAGNTSNGFYLWGVQVEAGAFPTSYIPTTTATATRSADVASITTLGANVRSLFSQFRSPASGTRPIVSLDDNSANNRIELFTSGTDPKLLITSGGAAQADIDAGSVTANTTTRLAARFSTDNFAASVSGTASITDTSGTLPAADRVRIGRDQAGNYLNGTIARVTAWDAALPMLAPVSG